MDLMKRFLEIVVPLDPEEKNYDEYIKIKTQIENAIKQSEQVEEYKKCKQFWYDKYQKLLKEINRLTLHAGCMGNPECTLCPIREKIEEIK